MEMFTPSGTWFMHYHEMRAWMEKKNVIEYLQRFALISSNDLSIATDLLESWIEFLLRNATKLKLSNVKKDVWDLKGDGTEIIDCE